MKEEFLKSIGRYNPDPKASISLWKEIEKTYGSPDRHYHNLNHLNSLVNELIVCKDAFAQWDSIVFATAYHDIVYNSLKSNNEEKSAEHAMKRLATTSFPKSLIEYCGKLILATKKHEESDTETNLFTDADLSILGADATEYQQYTQQIRKEYAIYPNIMYNAGRKKVLAHFLAMDSIFKTKEFADRYELRARVNIKTELDSLL